jgi:hypothetical protein
MRVTESAQRAVRHARGEVGRLGHDRLGIEHLLLGLAREHRLPSGDQLVLLSLELWSDWLDLRYAIAYATPEPEGDLYRPEVLGRCEVSDRVGNEYKNWVSSSPAFGMVRTHQHTFVPAPPPGTEVLELRFLPPSAADGETEPLVASTVVL